MRRAALVALALATALTPPIDAAGDREIKFKSRDLEKVKAQIDEKREEKEQLERQAAEISARLKESQSKAKDVESTLQYTRKKNSELESQVAQTKNQRDRLLSTSQDAEAALSGSVQRYYVAALITGPQAPYPVAARQVIHAEADRVRSLRSKSEETHKSLKELIQVQTAVRSEVERQESQLDDIKKGSQDRQRQLAKTMTRQEVLEKEVQDLQKTAEELASLIDVLRTKAKDDAARERETRKENIAAGRSPIPAHSLPWPITGHVATPFGRQDHPTLGTPFISNGIVIRTTSPDPVVAVADGKVLYVGRFMSYGSMVLLEHPGDWYTVYGQLGEWDVEKGQAVKKGDQLGRARERAEGGAEAYFELRFYGKPTDPLPWLTTAAP